MPIVYADPLKGRPREASRIPAPTSAVLEAQFSQVFEENPIMATKRFLELRRDERTGTALDAATARQRLKDAGLENDLTISDAGITNDALETLMWRKKVEKQRQDVFVRARGGLAEGAGRLGIAVATTMSDPISMGLNFVPVVGQARYARWLGAARGFVGRAGVRAMVGAAEGAAGAAIVEPFIYASRRYEQADYDAVDSLMNVAFGGFIGAGLHTTIGSVADLVSRPKGTQQTPGAAAQTVASLASRDQQATLRAAVAQAIQDQPIEVDNILAAAVPAEERVIQAQVAEQLAAREAELTTIIEGREAQTVAMAGDAGNYTADLQRTVELRDQIAREIAELPPEAAARRAELIEQQAQAQRVLDSRQAAVDRLNSVRTAEAELEQLRYARDSAKSLDDFIDVLPTSQQAGFRRRIEQGRQSGYVRSRGMPLATSAPQAAQPVQAADVERQQLDTYAKEVTAREADTGDRTADGLAMANEEAALATADLKALATRLGVEIKDATLNAVTEAVEKAERWAKTAELATVCLTRGG